MFLGTGFLFGLVSYHFGASLATAVLLLGACENITTDRTIAYDRVEAYLAKHPSTAPNVAAAMRRMDLLKGMTTEEVRATWGEPVNIPPSIRGVTHTWYFDCDYPHICRGAGGRRGRGTSDLRNTARAIFKDGRLIGSRI